MLKLKCNHIIVEHNTFVIYSFQVPDAFEKYTEVLISSEPTISTCTMLISMCAFDKSSFENRKIDVINVYIKSVIMSKFAAPPFALVS